jgi:alanine racemase
MSENIASGASSAAASPCRAYIHTDRLRRNFMRLGDPARLIPVVKSDAYGHGLIPASKVLAAAGARSFAVGAVTEALALRAACSGGEMILALLGVLDAEEAALAAAADIVPLVHDARGMELLAARGMPERPARIAVKWNTGMARLGFEPEEAGEVLERLRALPGLRPVLCLSHMAAADMPEEDAFSARQIRVFGEISALMKSAFPDLRASLANSAALLGHPAAAFDLARPGIALYGCNPFCGTSLEHLGADLECAMDVGAPLLQIRDLKPGESAGYGRAFTAKRAMRAGIIGTGYADGYARSFSGRGVLTLRGRRVPVLGRVCMGMLLIDASDAPDARPGDTAWILGGPDGNAVRIHELARLWGSIGYEVFCLLGRNEKRYLP